MTHNPADRQLIQEAMSKYTWGYDENDFAMLADAFTQNATSGGKVSGTDVAWGPMQGRDEIRSTLEGIRATQSDQRRHCVSNFIYLSQTETTATYRCYLNLIVAKDGAADLVTGGWYEVDAVKEGATWRMSRLDGVLDAPF